MRRSLVTAVLASTLVVAAPGPAPAAVTCHGLEATIVGSPDTVVEGTPGADVIVSNGSYRVLAGAGDDHVCVTDATGSEDSDGTVVSGEDGDDVITVDDPDYATGFVAVFPGPGEDAVVGGSGRDQVHASPGADTIDTGAGDDLVVVQGPAPVTPVSVDLGPGDDVLDLRSGTTMLGATLAGGPGTDRLSVEAVADATVLVDVPARRARAGGRDVATDWSSVETYRVGGRSGARLGAVAFRGSPRADAVVIGVARRLTVTTGRGDDRVEVAGAGRTTGRIDGGPGRNHLTATGPGVAVIDLGRGVLTGRAPSAAVARLARIRDAALLLAPPSRPGIVRGDDLDNRLRSERGRVDGRGGRDRCAGRTVVRCERGPGVPAQRRSLDQCRPVVSALRTRCRA